MRDYIPNMLLSLLFLGLLAWETVSPCKVFRYQGKRAKLWHGATNLGVGFVGAAVSYILFLPIWRGAAQWSGLQGWGLLHLMPAGFAGRICAALVLLDFWTYWWHRMNHRIGFLWRFHRMHHSDPWMDVTTAQRFHPGEMVVSSTLRIPVILLSGVELWHVALYDTVMLAVVLFHHANIAVSSNSDRLLRLAIPTPVMHKIHHSRVRTETDSNYTALFSIWDRIFGSLRLRTEERTVSFGLDGYDAPSSQSVAGLMKTPFENSPGTLDLSLGVGDNPPSEGENCGEALKWRRTMKKHRNLLLALAAVVIMSVVVVGCKKQAEHPGGEHPASTGETAQAEHPAGEHPKK